jgi:hypothetical protein
LIKGKDSVLFQEEADEKNLVAMHNLTAENLIHAERMGGLAVPSLSIGKKEHPLEGFGEITLIGSKELVDPKKASNKAFNADIYSPRYPSVRYSFDPKSLKEASESAAKEERDLGRSLGSDLDSGSFQQKGMEALYRSPILMLKYLRSIGQDVEIPRKKVASEYLRLNPDIERFVENWNPPSGLYENKEFIAEYAKLRQAVMDDARDKSLAAGNTQEEADHDAKMYGDLWYEDDGTPNYNIIRQLMNESSQKKEAGHPDYYAAERLIGDIIRPISDDFHKWVDQNYSDIIGKEQLYNGEDRNYNARYLPHTLENVVRVMKRELQAGEGFNYGLGNIRASVAKRYSSIKAIQADRDKVMSKKDFEKAKEFTDQEFDDIINEAYKVDGKIGTGDRFTTVLIDGIKHGNIEKELKDYGFGAMDVDRINAFLSVLRDMPTEYFEAKIQRAVGLNEFSGAVVPIGTDDRAIRVLERNNIPFVKYDQKVEGDRARAIKELSEKSGVLFQGGQGENKENIKNPTEEGQPLYQSKVNPRAQVDLKGAKGKKIITLFKSADQTSLVHEGAHIWFKDMFDFVKSGKADEEYLQHYSTIKNWLGIEDDQPDLTVEQQERFAVGFESFLREGNAPIKTDLQAAFDAFRSWMKKIYQSPDMLGEKLTPEVKDFYARLLGGERAMTMDEIQAQQDQLMVDLKSYAKSFTAEEISLLERDVYMNELEAEPIRELRKYLIKSPKPTGAFNDSELAKKMRKITAGYLDAKELYKGEWQDLQHKVRFFFSTGGVPFDVAAQEWFSSHPRRHESSMQEADEFRQLIIDTFVTNSGRLAKLNAQNRAMNAVITASRSESKAVDLGDVSEEEILAWAKQNAERIVQENLVNPTPQDAAVKKFAITMKQWMRDREKASKEGFKAGVKETGDKYKEIVETLRWTIKDISRVKHEIKMYGNAFLPKGYGKKISDLMDAATDQQGLIKAFIRINEMHDQYVKDTAINKLRDLFGKIASNGSIDIGYQKKALDLMSDVELKNHSDETMARIAAMKDAVDRGVVDHVTPEMAEDIRILSKKNIKGLTLSQLNGYIEKLEQYLKLARVKLRVRGEGRRLWKDNKLRELAGGSKSLTTENEYRNYAQPTTLLERIDLFFNKMKNAADKVATAISPIDVMFDELDGGRGLFNGVNFRTFKSVLDARFGEFLDLEDSLQIPFIKMAQDLGLTTINFERIAIYATSVQEGGDVKLQASLSPEQYKQFKNIKLTEDEMAWYQKARQILDSTLPAVKKLMYEEYNAELEAVAGYFPFINDYEAMSEAELKDRFGAYSEMIMENGVYTKSRKNPEKGFTVKRVGGEQKVMLNAFDIMMKHTSDVAYFLKMTKDIRILSEIAEDPRYTEIAGDRGRAFVKSWLELMAKKGGNAAETKIAWLDTVRRNIGVGTLGFKLTSALVQPTSLADAAGRIGGDWVTRGVINITDPKWVKLIMQMPEIRRRAGDDPAYASFLTGLNGGDFIWMRKMQEAGMRPLQYLDMLSAMATAAGAYEKYMTESGQEIDFEKIDPVGMERAQIDVRRSQSSGFFKDAPLMTTKGGLTGNVSVDKALAQFNNFVMNRFSTLHEVKAEFKRGDIQMLANRATFLILSAIMIQGIRAGVAALKDLVIDDDKDYDWEKGILTEALGNIPIAGNLITSWVLGRNASIPIPAISAVADVMKASSGAFTAKKPVTKQKNIARLVGATARVLGFPSLELQDMAVRAIGTQEKKVGRRLKFKKRSKINRKTHRKISRNN